jgi:hypothetical protein
MRSSLLSIAAASLSGLLFFGEVGLGLRASASTNAFEGKCGFLLDAVYQEQCTALFSDDVLTIMPKGSRQVRILPQQIAYIALANKSSLKVNEGLEMYNKMVPWWKPWDKIPNWVKRSAGSERVESHEFTIGYVDRNFSPKIALFILDDPSKAAAMSSELQAASGLAMGEKRNSSKGLDERLEAKLTKDVRRQSQRLIGLCSQGMFDDAEPVADALNTFVNNTAEEISIFDGSEKVEAKLRSVANGAYKSCDQEMAREVAAAAAAERARIAAIRRREAAARAQAAAQAAAYAAAARAARRAAFDSLTGST